MCKSIYKTNGFVIDDYSEEFFQRSGVPFFCANVEIDRYLFTDQSGSGCRAFSVIIDQSTSLKPDERANQIQEQPVHIAF